MRDKELEKITIGSQKLILKNDYPKVIRNFEDESLNIKRGYDIFQVHNDDWVDVCSIYMPNLAHHLYIEKLVENANLLDITIYENGILLRRDNDTSSDIKLISINDFDDDDNRRFRIMTNQVVMPSTYIKDIKNYISILEQIYTKQSDLMMQSTNKKVDKVYGYYTFNALVYNDKSWDYEQVKQNVYSVYFKSDIVKNDIGDIDPLAECAICNDLGVVASASKEVISGKKKILV